MSAAVDTVIDPRPRDLGGFEVRRILPFAKRRSVGPFVFFDHLGPAGFGPGEGIDVRPHPHIGLATVTYLFEGEIMHRDSLGCVQQILPGDVNWMTAGKGIVHSERSSDDARAASTRIHAIQSWVALPKDAEETDPAFHHHPKTDLPVIDGNGVTMRLIAGTAFGETAPVETFSETFYLHAEVADDTTITLSDEHVERAVYVVSGAVTAGDNGVAPQRMVIFEPGGEARFEASAGSRLMLLGGEPLDGKRHIWWNFVSSSEQKIEQAKYDWKNSKFPGVPGDAEFIPLPEG